MEIATFAAAENRTKPIVDQKGGDNGGAVKTVAGQPLARQSGATLANKVKIYLDTVDWDRVRQDYDYEIPPLTLLPARPALAACPALVLFARNAMKGWGPARHWLFHAGVRASVVVTLQIAHRLKIVAEHVQGASNGTPLEEDGGVDAAVDSPGVFLLPRLPPEMWHAIMEFFLRTDWPVPVPTKAHDTDKDVGKEEEAEEEEEEEDGGGYAGPKELIHIGY